MDRQQHLGCVGSELRRADIVVRVCVHEGHTGTQDVAHLVLEASLDAVVVSLSDQPSAQNAGNLETVDYDATK